VSHSAQQSLLQNQEFREAISNLISELLKRKAYGVYYSEGKGGKRDLPCGTALKRGRGSKGHAITS